MNKQHSSEPLIMPDYSQGNLIHDPQADEDTDDVSDTDNGISDTDDGKDGSDDPTSDDFLANKKH